MKRRRLTYLSLDALAELAAYASAAPEGVIVEAGAALGGSAMVIAAAKPRLTPMIVFDTFAVIPAPSERDGKDVHSRYAEIVSGRSKGIGTDTYYGYRSDLLSEVERSFRAAGLDPEHRNVQFVPGLFQDTIRTLSTQVALAHLDCDWYESTSVCLRLLDPLLAVGGRFVIDDYFTWSGARDAVDEFLAGRVHYRRERLSRLHLVKQANPITLRAGSLPDSRRAS